MAPAMNAEIAISACSASKPEGTGSNTRIHYFEITRTVTTSGVHSVDYAVSGSGTNPAAADDFNGGMLPSGTITFQDGEVLEVLEINIGGDQVSEMDETYTVTLSNPTGGAMIITPSAGGTIENDDFFEDFESEPAPVASFTSGDLSFETTDEVLVVLTNLGSGGSSRHIEAPSSGNQTVGTFGLSNSSTGIAFKLNGFDAWTSTNGGTSQNEGKVTFVGTKLDGTIFSEEFTISPPSITQYDVISTAGTDFENFFITSVEITLGMATGGGNLNYLALDDMDFSSLGSTAVLTIGNASVNEGNPPGPVTVDFPYSLTGNVPTFSVDVTFTDNTAQNGSDYDGSGISSFTINGTSGTNGVISVPIIEDNAVEIDETFFITLSNPVEDGTANSIASQLTIDQCTAIGTIVNDDVVSLSTVTVAVSPSSTPEDTGGNMVFTFTRTGGDQTAALTVNFDVSGTADFNTDYTESGADTYAANAGTLVIPANSSSATVSIDPSSDFLLEANETVILSIANSMNYTVGSAPDNEATATINDDETAGFTVTPTGGTTIVNETGTTDAFSVVLNAIPSSNVVIDLSVSGGFTDEIMLSQTSLTFTPTNALTAQNVTVTGQDDADVDGDQTGDITFSINQASSNAAFTGPADQQLSVTNEDNKTAGFTVVETGGMTMVGESGATDAFSVVLDAVPLSNVVIDLSVSGGFTDEIMLSQTSLTFTPTNALTAQNVTVTGQDDADVDGDQTGMITLSINQGQSDNAFDMVMDQQVSVINKDDEPLLQINGNGELISDGDQNPSNSDFTDFGVFNPNDAPSSRTFTLENAGSSISTLQVTGIDISLSPCFTLVSPTNFPFNIPGGNTSNLQIQFDPSGLSTGIYSATVTVTSNTNNVANTPYIFGVQARVLDPNSIPTMGQWAFFISLLLVFIVGLVGLYNLKGAVDQ